MSPADKPHPDPPPSPGLFSRIKNRWHVLLALWLLITLPIVCAIYVLEPPRFEAVSLLRVAPASASLFEPNRPEEIDPRIVAPYMQTQIGLITSDRVLGAAVASPNIAKLSVIRSSNEPNAELRTRMNVAIVPDSYLIRVALELQDGDQAATVLNAVVHSYIQYNAEYQRSGNSALRRSLAEHREKYGRQIDEKRQELRTIMRRPDVVSHPRYHASGVLSEEQSNRVAQELVEAQLELIKTQSNLEATEAAGEEIKDPHIRQKLRDLKTEVAALVKRKEYLAKYFDSAKVELKVEYVESLDTEFVKRELDTLLRREDLISTQLKQLEFEAEQADHRVTLVDDAVPPRTSVNNRRFAYMAAAPLVVCVALMSLALCVPRRGSQAWAGE